ncbi:substrate-binding periplasmic protein [Psychromonas aquimarina]|uniref:substrate-binding periplasmic protein n=1 Tax=Psychromonas aquimarina TaxID=444919 RepID=UPI0004201996|nr:transporter substrate-binding domain-containing protein [Psychromonas aquimarina]
MYCRALCIAIILSAGIPLTYAAPKIVKIVTLHDYAPFCMTSGDYEINQVIVPGQDALGFSGYSWDILRESFHEMGYVVHLSIRPWARAVANVKNNKADIVFPTGKNSKRLKIFTYSLESVNHADYIVYVRADDPIQWRGLQSLNGLTIGVKKGFSYGNAWRQASAVNKYDVLTILQGFKMLNAGRIDGFAGYEFNWDYILQRQNWHDKYRKLDAFGSTSEYLAALKSNPKGKEFLSAFDQGKKRLRKNGRLEQIRIKWFGK